MDNLNTIILSGRHIQNLIKINPSCSEFAKINSKSPWRIFFLGVLGVLAVNHLLRVLAVQSHLSFVHPYL
jgi:hypothetical protein